ncbi:MAG TPA: efflux transporter outer membrane subunit [Vicinamibacterales bacterium]|nr:efflux transporter outer membrane subunit [Vicinamibacterales bacterium]
MIQRARSWIVCGIVATLASACASRGPVYERPAIVTPAAWDAPAPFRASAPQDSLPKGQWWTVFGDEQLDALEQQAATANQSIKVAAARYEQARALTREALSARYPQVAASGQVLTQRLSGTRAGATEATTQSAFTLPVSVSYEVDLFGRRLKSIEAAETTLQASAADLENVKLIIAADLATNYFTLRRLDSELDLLGRAVDVLQRALDVVRNRFTGGIASGLDVAQEETLLASTRTQATLVRQQREQFEHAIAVLVGQPAPGFDLPSRPLTDVPPAVRAGVPTDLLERRPDIAEAERQVAAANARLGVAHSAFFPSLNLLGSGGWESGNLAKIFDVPSLIWAVGATIAQDVFTGGARQARVDFAVADVEAAAASYRDTVLRAMAEVQDALSGLDVLNDAATTQAQAVAAANRALQIANNRYVGGLASSLDLVSAQQTLLDNQRLAVQLDGDRLVATVSLIKALGGGWDASSLASAKP